MNTTAIQPAESIADIKTVPFFSQFTTDQLREQMKRCLDGLEQMMERGQKKFDAGKKYNGFTKDELQASINRYKKIVANG